MLKACWDCLAGPAGNRNQVENEESYGIRLNGDTQRAPPWPPKQANNDKMYLLPKVLSASDSITVHGTISPSRNRLSIGLVTENYYDSPGSLDHANIACVVDLQFPDDKLFLLPGSTEDSIQNFIDSRESSFQFKFFFDRDSLYGGLKVGVMIGEALSELGEVQLKPPIESIRYLVVKGDVQSVDRLTFEFKS